MTTTPWWEDAFSAEYLEVYAHRSDEIAGQEVAGLLPHLRQAPGPVLDACCGNGRHLAALRRAGVPALGFDLSSALITAAGGRAEAAGRLVRCDMRSPPFAGGWGAILLLFTTFGYFDDYGNAQCLNVLSRLLVPGGWMVIDVPDGDHLRATLVQESRRSAGSGVEIFEIRQIRAQRIEKEVRLERHGQTVKRYRESVRLYAPQEMAGLAQHAGLDVVESWSSLQGADRDDHRCVYWLRMRAPG